MKDDVARRAVHIAAVIMQRDGLCRYEAPTLCKKVYPPDDAGCVRCIESWLLSRARRELKKEERT
ncbi:MAG: hypothetical protein IJT62_05635 [Oscillospiraceae bacterium]|nr:hypothetical protein [Oscillospiraceae bacterium]